MTRKKFDPLAPIMDTKARCSTYRKRKETLMRKTSELSELCGVDACIIIYEPHSRKPDVWPEWEKTLQILSRFGGAPDVQRNRNMVDQNGIMFKKIEKLRAELRKVEEENCRLEAMILLQDVAARRSAVSDVVDAGKMSSLSAMVEMFLNEVRERMHELLPVQQSVGPLEEVLLQDPLHWPSIDVALPSKEHNFCFFGADVLSQKQHSFGSDVGSQEKDQYNNDLSRIVMASQVQYQYIEGLSSVDTASPVNKDYIVDLVSADTEQLVQKKCVFGMTSADISPLQDEEICWPSWCPVVGSSEEEDGQDSVSTTDVLSAMEKDDISQLFDWSCSGFEEILASI